LKEFEIFKLTPVAMAYPTDMSDSQWQYIKIMLDDGRKRKHSLRLILNAIFYVVKTGSQWRMLPSDFPAWQSVYNYLRKWRLDPTLDQLHADLHRHVRQQQKRDPSPSLGIMDAQSVPTTMHGGIRGFDGNKRVKGGKRHGVVDTLGLIIGVFVCGADKYETEITLPLLKRITGRFERLCTILGDSAYEHGVLMRVIERDFGWLLEVSKRSVQAFVVKPKRWIVERTFAWFGGYRRLSKDDERLTPSSEAMILWATVSLMRQRL